jgi:hypothetical protein
VHFTFTTDDNKNLYFRVLDLEQKSQNQFALEPSTFVNESVVQNTFKNDNLLNYNETENIENRKRKRLNKQNRLAQEDNQKYQNESGQEYDSKFQKLLEEDNQQNSAENNKAAFKIFFSNLMKNDENSMRNEKRKRSHNTTYFEENEEQKKRKKEYHKKYREQNSDRIKE